VKVRIFRYLELSPEGTDLPLKRDNPSGEVPSDSAQSEVSKKEDLTVAQIIGVVCENG
jgi:hypothetical protein